MRLLDEAMRARSVSALFGVSALIVVAGFAWGYAALSENPSVILHYGATSFEGTREVINQYGVPVDLFRIGFLGLIAIFMNYLIGLEFTSRDRFMAKLLAVMTLIFSILLFIGVAAIISVN